MAGRWRNADRRASISCMDKWRNGVAVVRAASLAGKGRATAFDFAGTGGQKTWIGTVTMQPGVNTGMHPHQERNLSDSETVDFVVVRSGNEGFATKLDAAPVGAEDY